MIIGLLGEKGTGKSMIAEYLCNHHGFTEYAIAKPLKDIAKVFGFTNTQLYGTQKDKTSIHPQLGISAREFLQKFGTEICRTSVSQHLPTLNLGESGVIWIRLMENFINQSSPDDRIVISDVRFPDEALSVKKLGGIILRIQRSHQGDAFSEHVSEQMISTIDYDHLIENKGTRDELYKTVIKIIDLY